jgi:transglutaminase-like putative cysteine protease
VSTSRSVTYEVVQELVLANGGPGQPDKHNLWLALIRSLPPYQTVLDVSVTPGNYRIATDEHGNRYAEFDLADLAAGSSLTIRAQYRVSVNELRADLSGCPAYLDGSHLKESHGRFLLPELHIESMNPQIVELAGSLSEGQQTVCDQLLAFYDYARDNLLYTFNTEDWGAQAALGEMGADCTEYASLVTALSRASGIPARYLEGVVVREDGLPERHAWLEAFVPEIGWLPLDPTVGRAPKNRLAHFARIPSDHLIVTVGRNPSTLRGSSYWTHLYWPGDSAEIRVEEVGWQVERVED